MLRPSQSYILYDLILENPMRYFLAVNPTEAEQSARTPSTAMPAGGGTKGRTRWRLAYGFDAGPDEY
jgi:hypothetical protein